MQTPLQITVHGMAHSAPLDLLIRERVSTLERIWPRIISCRVTIDKPPHHQRQGELFDVTVNVQVPGKPEVVINRQHAVDVYVAVRDAFEAARRKLLDQAHSDQDDVKRP